MKKLLILFICISFSFLNAQETVDLYIIDGNDDAYQLYGNVFGQPPVGEMFVDADKLFMGYTTEPLTYYWVGLRYQSVPIPPGSTIESAYVQFYSSEANDDTTAIMAGCERNVNPLPFTSVDYNITDRESTFASENWVASEWQAFIPGPNQRTHNIESVIQEVIDLEDWVKNNPMVVLFRGLSLHIGDYPKAACSWEFGGEFYAPVLTITYTAPASVDEEELAKALNIFPNPVSDKFTVSLNEIKKGEYTISLFDLQGRKVYEVYNGFLPGGDHQFDMSADELKLVQGIYMLSIHSSVGDISRKIIVR